MLKDWQFDVLFVVGVGSALVMLFGPTLGLDIETNPLAVSGVGAILTYVLTQKRVLTKTEKKDQPQNKEEDDGLH